MAFFGFLKREKDILSHNNSPHFTGTYSMYVPAKMVMEQFKGEIERQEIKFPKELGEQHPFDYSLTEKLYIKYGFITGVIDKIVDFCWGPGFRIQSKDKRAQEIIEQWLEDVNFVVIGRKWLKEALIKGTAYLELGGNGKESPQGLKVLNSDTMFIQRDNYGNILNYNQQVGGIKQFNTRKVISFEPNQIAHITINDTTTSPYGYGLVYSALDLVDNLIGSQKDMHVLIGRKANTPIVATLGDREKDIIPTQEVIDSFGAKLTYMTNKTEWVVGDDIKLSTLDFGKISDKFSGILDHDLDMLFFTFQVPEVLMGRGSIPEGLAVVQMDAFERRIKSFQSEMEQVIETKIFKRILNAHGLDLHVELEWGMPSQEEINKKIVNITNLLANPMLSSSLRVLLEKQLAELMGFDEELLIEPEEEREEEEETEKQPIVPGQNEKLHTHENFEDLNRFNTLHEWLGFSYKDYMRAILGFIDADTFEQLRAHTMEELEAGRLSDAQIRKLKKVMHDGFEKHKTISDISENIRKRVKPKELYDLDSEGKIVLDTKGNPRLAISQEFRPIMIARTEATRAANRGTFEHYKRSDVQQYKWIAAMDSKRTCPLCEDLNGKVFEMEEMELPPRHTFCRCTIGAVTDLD